MKSAIIGTFVVDRVVTSPRTLTTNQRRWYMGDENGLDSEGRTVYGHILGERKLLPRPIPWDGALGLWTVPPLIAAEIQRQLGGEHTPAYRPSYVAALAGAGVETATEWATKRPGEHLWFTCDNIPSCVCCGKVKPREGAKRPAKPCKGVINLSFRSE